MRCDVTSDADVDSLAEAAFAEFGTVDLVMNNAGIAVLGPSYRVPMADWQRILDVNVLGLVRGVRAFVPAMVERGHGYVVNTASIAGIWAYIWDCAPYITSKFAAYGYSEALARSLRPLGVGVSVLCPGLVHTNLGEHGASSGVPDEYAGLVVHFPPEMAADAVDADAVGPMVCDAVEAERFTIFTNDNDAELYVSWRTDIDASLADRDRRRADAATDRLMGLFAETHLMFGSAAPSARRHRRPVPPTPLTEEQQRHEFHSRSEPIPTRPCARCSSTSAPTSARVLGRTAVDADRRRARGRRRPLGDRERAPAPAHRVARGGRSPGALPLRRAKPRPELPRSSLRPSRSSPRHGSGVGSPSDGRPATAGSPRARPHRTGGQGGRR